MLTPLGKYLRKLRIDKGEILKNMSDKLKVTVSFLSAVENGKKKMPSEWNQKICDLYKLDDIVNCIENESADIVFIDFVQNIQVLPYLPFHRT